MNKHIVESTIIEKDAYRISPPRWILKIIMLFLISSNIIIIFQPQEIINFKWVIFAFLFIITIGLFKNITNINYLVTLASDRKGLYFQTANINKYFFIPWKYIHSIDKTSFPQTAGGLRVNIDCEYYNDAKNELGNVIKEAEQCFIYTIPQIRYRDKVIKALEENNSL